MWEVKVKKKSYGKVGDMLAPSSIQASTFHLISTPNQINISTQFEVFMSPNTYPIRLNN